MPRGTMFGIWDLRFGEFCGLPSRRPNEGPDGRLVWPEGEDSWWLEFSTPERAQRWLRWCVDTWKTWPQEFAPSGYGRRPEKTRPAATRRRQADS